MSATAIQARRARLSHDGWRTGALIAAAGLIAVCLPVIGLPTFYQAFFYLVFLWIALATSWAIFSGNTGYFSFAHGAFFGIGAYVSANIVQTYPAAVSVLAAGAVAGIFAVGFGAVVFRVERLRGEVFALLTLALSFVVGSVVLNTPLDGGSGVFIAASRIPRTFGNATTTLYMAQATVAGTAVLAAWAVQRMRFGEALLAISDAETVAEICGVPTYSYKVAALGLSALIAGLAGGVQALFVGYVTVADTFSVTVPLYVLLMGVLGGARHWAGPAIGAAVIASVNAAFVGGNSALAARATVGVALVLCVLFLPEGVLRRPEWTGVRRRRPTMLAGSLQRPAPTAPVAIMPVEKHGLSDKVILTCRSVTHSFRGIKALDGIDLELRAGEILGLVGPNGSGKSTLINAISGFYSAQSGSITFEGRDLTQLAGHRIAKLGIARTFQIPRPFARLTVLDNVRLAAMFGAAQRFGAGAKEEAQRCLELVDLQDRAFAFPPELNLHQRKFLEFARTLATGAHVILLDEVLAGMTPAEIEGSINLIRRIRAMDKTIVFVEHNIRAVLELTDRLAVLDQGRIIALGAPRAVMADPTVVSAYLGDGHA